ncbi:Lysosomal Cystine Transporter [Teladorsagia circumcincta]|uniref:Lysosomal Cystine Transporter n=1 Tax=Teladorsagia circumcincta TaxID=45464 RepID=A0A2G9TYK7_TELCI|nr:Lysosomal Cystine Transporter [Teladorsagia circumcincta]
MYQLAMSDQYPFLCKLVNLGFPSYKRVGKRSTGMVVRLLVCLAVCISSLSLILCAEQNLTANPTDVLVEINETTNITYQSNIADAFVRVSVIKSHLIQLFTIIVGWMYFVAWSLSFYPQIILNFRRKAYSLYNLFMYFDPNVQARYKREHPKSPIPVLLNDVVFAVHAFMACVVTAVQCFIYETYFNFKRKSTVGWSIGNVLLDFTGGSLDILQMVLQCVNADNWVAFYGNPVKFGLGLVSIFFDIIFIIQHYVLYRGVKVVHAEYEGIENPIAPQSPSSAPSDHGSINQSQDPILQDVQF